MNKALSALAAQAELHHPLLLGQEPRVATREVPQVVGDWMFRLFRLHREAKFLPSFATLGLDGLPHAVDCARHHVLSSGIGGVHGGPRGTAAFPAAMLKALGDTCRAETGEPAQMHPQGPRVPRGPTRQARAELRACWTELWRGTLHARRAFMEPSVEAAGDDGLVWTIRSTWERTS
jgi:hypothetical protein